ncbi:hypothetical protein CPB86DRAFT_816149 [Serendipita vermifera]|nr:hypothetical protein CPB86DRAFT_816149 [Serendipita vermifera]
MEIRWGEIFDLLGTSYAQAAASRELNEDDERGLGILLRCLRNPRIGPMIAPEQHKEYQGTSSEIATIDKEDFGGLNPVYVLLRNIELPGVSLSLEQQVKLRVGSLNCAHRTLQSAKQLVGLQRDLTSKRREDMWGDIIPILCKDIKTRAHENEQERVDNLICLAFLHQPPIQDVPLRLYNGWGNGWQRANYSISTTVSRPSIFYYRLWCANWIEPLVNHPHIHAILGALDAAQRRDPRLRLLWRFVTTEEEVDVALGFVDPDDRPQVSAFIKEQRKDHYLPKILKAFDNIIKQGCNKDELEVIIRLLCNDLRNAGSPLYDNTISDWNKELIESLQNPWLRLIGYAVAGSAKWIGPSLISDIEMPDSIGECFGNYLLSDQSLVDPSTLPQLRMRFFRDFEQDKRKRFIIEALTDIKKLKHLQTEFKQPSLGVDFGGDFLLHIFYSPFNLSSRRYEVGGEWESDYGRVPDFLVHDKDEPSEFIRRHPGIKASTDCIPYLLELCRDIKRNPGRLIRLLIHMVSCNLEYIKEWDNPICVMDLYDILKVVKECGLGKNGTAHITNLYELAGLVRKCRVEVTDRWDKCRRHVEFGSLMEQMCGKEDFRVECNQVLHDLISQSLTIFGLQARRLVICARPTVTADPAADILRMYDN